MYAEQVVEFVSNELKPSSPWKKASLEDCLKDWLLNRAIKRFEGMPSFMVSCIWCARNSSIFNDKDTPLEVTTGIILNLPKEFLIDIEIKDPRVSVMLELDFGIPWGFFDGVCQGHPPVCGVGVFLCINHNHYIHVCYAPERGTNDRAEFIALRTLLEIASIKDVKKL